MGGQVGPACGDTRRRLKTDLGHCYYAFVTSLDEGAMDGFDLAPKGVCPRGWGGGQPAGTLPYQFVNHNQIAPYWDIAHHYVLADHMFQTQGSGSFTAHQDLIRGGTAVSTSETMIDTPDGMPWGCDAKSPATRTDALVNGKWKLDAGPFPCTKKFPSSGSYETLADLLDAKSVTWKYYSPCFSASPNCSNACTECAGALLNAFDVIAEVRYGSEWSTNVSMPQTNVLNDIAKGALPAVAWVVPSDEDSDHPGAATDHGPEWIASIVNAIGESAYWKSTAIVIVWDDWGGLYDHVKPPLTDTQGGLGFRVPMLVVSPYVANGRVTHTQYEFGASSNTSRTTGDWGAWARRTSARRALTTFLTTVKNREPLPRFRRTIRRRFSAARFPRPQAIRSSAGRKVRDALLSNTPNE